MSDLRAIIDKKGLLALGYTRQTVDRLFAELPVYQRPGERKLYVYVEDVQADQERHTVSAA